MNVSVSGTIDQKMYLKKFRGGFSPIVPPGSAYEVAEKKLNTPSVIDFAQKVVIFILIIL